MTASFFFRKRFTMTNRINQTFFGDFFVLTHRDTGAVSLHQLVSKFLPGNVINQETPVSYFTKNRAIVSVIHSLAGLYPAHGFFYGL